MVKCLRYPINLSNRRVRTRTHGGVGGGGREAFPYPDWASHNNKRVASLRLKLNRTSALYPHWGSIGTQECLAARRQHI